MQGTKIKSGEMHQLQKGTMLVTLWFDKRQVAVLSSNCNPDECITVQRRAKAAPHVKDVDIPTPINLYNRSMGGMDLNDQYRSYYPSGRSGKKWWHFIFWFLVDVSVCNAFIMEGISPHLPSSRSRRPHLQFKLELAKQLIGDYSGRKRYAGKKRKATPFDNAMLLRNLPGHHEVKLKDARECAFAALSMAEGIHQDVPLKLYMAAIAVVFTCAEVAAFFNTTQKTHLYNFSTFAIYVIPIINCTNLVTTPLD